VIGGITGEWTLLLCIWMQLLARVVTVVMAGFVAKWLLSLAPLLAAAPLSCLLAIDGDAVKVTD
jgi:hypothetical protein